MADNVFTVSRVDELTAAQVDIGRLRCGPGGHLDVVSADPAHSPYLTSAVNRINATDELSIKVAPPPDADDYSVWFRIVDRSAPDLPDVLRTCLERDYGLILAPSPTALDDGS